MGTRYIVIPNWQQFQHYKDRTPLWIKTYVELLADDAYLKLTGHQRAILHGIWLEYASARCQLAANTATLTRRLGIRVSPQSLAALKTAGFIKITASKPLAQPTDSASPEVEVENKRLKAGAHAQKSKGARFARNVAGQSKREWRPYDPPQDPAGAIRAQIQRGIISDPIILQAELDAHGINGEQADELHALLPQPTKENQ